MMASSQTRIKPKFINASSNNVFEPKTNPNHKHNKAPAKKMLQQL
jgi:hypothetical protein